MLEYKPDWEECKTRFAAWWRHENADRPLMSLSCVRADAPAAGVPKKGDMFHYLDKIDEGMSAYDAGCRRQWFGGEAFPNQWINLGPGVMASYIGAVPVVGETTVWFETPMDWDTLFAKLVYNPDAEWWKLTRAMTRRSVERGTGKWITGITDLGGNLDILASLRGAQQLLMDLIECPEKVKLAVSKIDSLWSRYYSELASISQGTQHGTSAWMGLWCDCTWYPLQCDFSVMISPAMFEEFVVPSLQDACRGLDRSIYHWDGPGQLPHLEALLEIDGLDGIQWVPGDGHPDCSSEKWFPLYKKIQAKGKNLVLNMPGDPVKIERVIRELKPEGLYMTAWVRTEEEGKALLEKAPDWIRPG